MDRLIAQMRYPVDHDDADCRLATVGKPRRDESSDDGTNQNNLNNINNFVNVNRPLQRRTNDHDMKYCDSTDFSQREFFRTPRGNTCWCLLTGECPHGCGIDCAGNCGKEYYATANVNNGTTVMDDDTDTGGHDAVVLLYCDEHWAAKDTGTWNANKCRDNHIYGNE
jgi:hypothetical protein